MSRTAKIVVAVVAVVAFAGLAVGLTLWLTSSDGSGSTASHAEYQRLYDAATIGTTRIEDVEKDWPQPPYQDFHDGTGHRCLEWFDRPEAGTGILYDLCFNENGVLLSKQTP